VNALLNYPESVTIDPFGDILFFDDHVPGGNLRKIDRYGVITTVAVLDDDAEGFAFCNGRFYLSAWDESYVYTLDPCLLVEDIAGNGTRVHQGDGGPAGSSALNEPVGLAMDPHGNLYMAEYGGHTIRVIEPGCSNTPTPACTIPATPTHTGTYTPTGTLTIQPTFTPSITLTPTVTLTPTITLTPTPTQTPLGPLRLWPNPFDPSKAVRGTLKCADMPEGSSLTIYTLSGEKVFSAVESGYRAEWDGKTEKGAQAATGAYYYLVRRNREILLKGVLILSID
jgi:hypothetical protein